MIELIGALFGGALRFAPELLKWFERRDERKHELAMLGAQLEADKQRAELGLLQTNAEGEIKISLAEIQALTETAKAQAQPTGIPKIDAMNAAMRPILVYWWAVLLSTVVLIAKVIILITSDSMGTAEALVAVWGEDERAIVASIFAFVFVDRTLRHKNRGTE